MRKAIRLFISCLLVIVSLMPISNIYAVDSSSSAIVSTTPQIATKSSSLLQKLNTLKAEIASKAAELRIAVDKKIQNKAIVGFAKDKNSSQIILTTKNGDKTVIVNEYTTFESKARKPSLDDLDKNDYIAALGDMDDKNNLVAKKIVWLTKPSENTKSFFWGQVQAINGVTLIIKNRDDQKINIFTNSNTSFGVGDDEASFSDIKVSKFLSGVGTGDIKNGLQANFIYLIPSGGTLKSSNFTASSSAKLIK